MGKIEVFPLTPQVQKRDPMARDPQELIKLEEGEGL